MTKALCPDGCGKKFISAEHAEKHADAAHPGWRVAKPVKRRGWATPDGFMDFAEPVTYEEALAKTQEISNLFWGRGK
jgi:predicted cobalt transporter CbtA